ncbi:MAG: hypothetical protein Q8S21_00095 [Candidatus Paracaedibacteraceae bacterium]|nr:hypothetical protein [Candidatus Paracaedibacteraceae bacterium]
MSYNKPYLLCSSYRTPKHMVNYKWRERTTDPFIFSQGNYLPYDSGNDNLECTKTDPSTYDLIFHSEVKPSVFTQYDNLANNGGGLLLVNKKIIDILLQVCPDDIQIFPAIILPENPKKMTFENHNYWVLNLTKTVDVIDKENSTYTQLENLGLKFPKTVTYVQNSMGDVHIGRQYNYQPDVIASPELVKIFKREKITGLKFKKDNEYIG